MKLAILGADAQTAELARAIAGQRRHSVLWICESQSGPRAGRLDDIWHAVPGARPLSQWESLLDARLVDGVIVAADANQELRAEQVRRLVQAGVPVLASHPVVSSMLVYYELEMIRGDLGTPALAASAHSTASQPVRGVLVPALALRNHPAVERLAAIVQERDASPIGQAEQLACERHLAVRERDAVLAQLTRDLDLLRAICGEFARLGTLGRADDPNAFANLSVQLVAVSGMSARWSVGPADATALDRLILQGDRGRATLFMPPAPQEWTLVVSDAEGERTTRFPDWSPARAALDSLESARAGQATSPTWLDATKTVEIAETAVRSLAKGRTLDLYREEFSEQGTFKGTMASWGCGLLITTIVTMCAAMALLQFGVPLAQLWPYALLALLATFLVLQFLALALPRRDEPEPTPSDNSPDNLGEV